MRILNFYDSRSCARGSSCDMSVLWEPAMCQELPSAACVAVRRSHVAPRRDTIGPIRQPDRDDRYRETDRSAGKRVGRTAVHRAPPDPRLTLLRWHSAVTRTDRCDTNRPL